MNYWNKSFVENPHKCEWCGAEMVQKEPRVYQCGSTPLNQSVTCKNNVIALLLKENAELKQQLKDEQGKLSDFTG
jgi:hypothetical protein